MKQDPVNIQQKTWLSQAKLLKPELHADREVPAEYDKMRLFGRRNEVELDFGRHQMGHVTIRLGLDGGQMRKCKSDF